MHNLKRHKALSWLLIMTFLASMVVLSGCGTKAEKASSWTLINPEGTVKLEPVKLNHHPASLEGKTVALRWNGKENGDNFLNRVAELLQKNVKNVKVIKLYETMPETVGYGPSKMGPDVIKKVVALKPDLIIGAQAD